MKTFFKFGIIVLVAHLIFSSCRKDKPSLRTTVSGKVLTLGNNAAIGGVIVVLSRQNADIVGAWGYQTVSTAVSDNNGNYSFDFIADENYIYVVSAQKPPYSNSDIYPVYAGSANAVGMYLIAPAYIKLHIKNVAPYDSPYNYYDHIYVDFSPYGGAWSFTLWGTAIDTIIKRGASGYYNNKIRYIVTKNSVSYIKDTTVYCPGFDTTLFNINY